jgi:hypothetical protein
MWLYVIGATVLTGIGLVIIYLYNVNYPVELPLVEVPPKSEPKVDATIFKPKLPPPAQFRRPAVPVYPTDESSGTPDTPTSEPSEEALPSPDERKSPLKKAES